ncbi:Uncharacterised protein [Mycobacteroides abscessus subsp. abscessus]|nr:Uncharacterised protein [Mycobacteroides abscessus subsp. abscessus]
MDGAERQPWTRRCSCGWRIAAAVDPVDVLGSGAITVKCSASCACTLSHVAELSPIPWMSSSTGPEPAIR